MSFWLLAVPLTLMGLSNGMTISPNQTLTLNSVDPRYGGVAGPWEHWTESKCSRWAGCSGHSGTESVSRWAQMVKVSPVEAYQ